MNRGLITIWRMAPLLLFFLGISHGVFAKDGAEGKGLGPQSTQAIGQKNVLMVVVQFPDATPTTPIETLKRRVVDGLGAYVKEQSYGLSSIRADFRGYVMLPDRLADYKVSPYNFQVERRKIRKLIKDTMTAIEKETDFSAYDHLLIIPAVTTMPGSGYGMLCYCANPGMLSGVSRGYAPHYETLKSSGGKEFKGGIFVGAENANVGMFAHDYFHALAGIYGGKRLAPCLYDYERQSDPSAGLPSFEQHAIYMGPWDIMSQHFVKKGEPPPGISSFTKIRLGWIEESQVEVIMPGGTSISFLSPLAKGGQTLAVKIPLADGTYYLIENRQAIGYDKILPASGLLILKVHPEADEGYGTVEVKSAGALSDFTDATYKLEVDGRNLFIDNSLSGSFQRNNIAIIPLWKEDENLGLLVTTIDQSAAAIKAARAIQALFEKNQGKDSGKNATELEAINAFKKLEFDKSYAIATKTSEVQQRVQ